MLIVDRFEGDWAVIEYEGTTFNLPRSLLSLEVKEGDVFTLNISINQMATKERRQKGEEMMKDFFDN